MAYLFARKLTDNLSGRKVSLETRVRLENDRLIVDMRTWARGLRGAHATHNVALFDSVGNQLWVMPTVLLGVSGKGEFWNRKGQNRSTTYNVQVPIQFYSDAKGVLIQHGDRQQSAFFDWLAGNWETLLRIIIELAQILSKQEEDAAIARQREGSFAEGLKKAGSPQEKRSLRAMTASEYASYEKRVLGGEDIHQVRKQILEKS